MNNHTNSQDLFLRATESIPAGVYGHLGPGEGCFLPVDAYPLYMDHAEGAYFWDIDDHRYIDYMCAYGPIILGYNDPDVISAAQKQMNKVDCGVLPSSLMVDLAELLVDTIDSADWAFFAKNGGDVTNLAVLTARAATGRDKLIMFSGGYHGVAQWMQKPGYPGITDADQANNIVVNFGDYAAIEKAITDHKGEVAALIATPYHHPIFEDNVIPPAEFWQKVRALCDREGVVLIFDDVRCGFRLDVAGSDHFFGIKADLSCYCKALANGFNISALVGREDLKEAAASVFYTGSYWLSAVPMAAAIACVTKLREVDSAKTCWTQGEKLIASLTEAAEANGFTLTASGAPSMPFLRTSSYQGTEDPDFLLHQAFIGEMVKRGVFMTNHHNHFLNTAVTDEVIAETTEAAHEAYRVTATRADKLLSRKI